MLVMSMMLCVSVAKADNLTVEEAKDIIFEAEPKKTKGRKKKAE